MRPPEYCPYCEHPNDGEQLYHPECYRNKQEGRSVVGLVLAGVVVVVLLLAWKVLW